MNNLEIQRQILQAIDTIAENKVKQIKFDKTVEAIIKDDIKSDVGEYKVLYQDIIFTAYSNNNMTKYKIDDNVLVLIPQGDMSSRKTITSLATGDGASFIDIEDIVDKMGLNFVNEPQDFSISLSTTQDSEVSFKIRENDMIYNYPGHSMLYIGADIYTNINLDSPNGDFGIELVATFMNDKNERYDHTYSLKLQDVTGNPYQARGFKYIKLSLLEDRLVGVKSARAYTTGFRHGNEDIVIKELEIQYLKAKDNVVSEYTGNIFAPSGLHLKNAALQPNSTLDLVMQFKKSGQVLDTDAVSYKWFLMDATVNSTSNDRYHPDAGMGWRLLLPGDFSEELIQGVGTKAIKVSAGFIPTFVTFKCIAYYNDIMASDTATLVDHTEDLKIAMYSSNGITFKNGIGQTTLYCQVEENNLVAKSVEYIYAWSKIDMQGNITEIQVGNVNQIEVTAQDVGDKMVYVCEVSMQGGQLPFGKGNIALVNIIDGQEGTSQNIVVVGGFRTALYDKDGNAPDNLPKDGFRFDIYVNGGKVTSGVSHKWIIPSASETLLTMNGAVLDSEGRQTTTAEILYLGIDEKFNLLKNNNVVTIEANFKINEINQTLRTDVPISITKVGQNGADGAAGRPGQDGSNYVYEILGGAPVISYDENGANPEPAVIPELFLRFAKDGDIAVVKDVDEVIWRLPSDSALNFVGSESTRTITTIKDGTPNPHKINLSIAQKWDLSKSNNYLEAEISYGGMVFREYYPISVTKNGAAGQDGAQGIPGEAGSPAKYIIVSGENVFKKSNKDYSYRPARIELIAQRFNIEQIGQWFYVEDDGSEQVLSTMEPDTLELTSDFLGLTNNSYATFGYKVGSYRDVVTVYKVADGDGATLVVLSNENHSVPTNGAGLDGNYDGAETTITIYKNGEDVTSQWTIEATPSTGVTGAYISSTKTYKVSNMTKDVGTVRFTATKSGEAELAKVFSLSKTKSGTDGLDGKPGINGEDGKTYYTWIKYADSPTSGMSDLPNGKAYIGLSYNNQTSVESSDYSDYAWSLIKGTDGRPGINGEDGQTYYTWIRYADTPTTGMSPSATGKEYIGIAYNKTSATPSSDYGQYAWSKIQGTDGRPGVNGEDGKTYYTWIKYADSPTSGMSDNPLGKKYMGIAYNKLTATESSNYNDYAWSKVQGNDGAPGEDGIGYTLEILGGARGIAYAADGSSPNPSTSPNFSFKLLKNGVQISPETILWQAAGCLGGSGNKTTFAPIISNTFSTGNSYVRIAVTVSGIKVPIEQLVPIVCTKHADGLDWINEWNGTATSIKDHRIVTPRIFAGTNKGTNLKPNLSGVALGLDVLTGSNSTIGIVGYRDNDPRFKLDLLGNFFVGSGWDSAGTAQGQGLKYDSTTKTLSISGKMEITSGSSIGGASTDKIVSDSELGAAAKDKLDNLSIGDRNFAKYGNLEIPDIVANKWISYPTSCTTIGTTVYTGGSGLPVDMFIRNQKIFRFEYDSDKAPVGETYGGMNVTTQERLMELEPSTYYTFTYWVYKSRVESTHVNIWAEKEDGTAELAMRGPSITDTPGHFVKVKKTFKTLPDATKHYIRYYIYPFPENTGKAVVYFYQPTLVKGEVEKDWTPSMEDVNLLQSITDGGIDNANNTANSALSGLEAGKPSWDASAEQLEDWTTPGKTTIDGGKIETNSIKADTLDVLGLSVHRATGDKGATFAVTRDGEIIVDGLLESANFNNTEHMGYRIDTTGNAVFNQVQIRGEVQLPNAGMTNYAGLKGGTNLIPYTDFSVDFSSHYQAWGTSAEKVYVAGEEALKCHNTTLTVDDPGNGILTPRVRGGIEANVNYTLSFRARSSSNTAVLDYIYVMSNTSGIANVKLKSVSINSYDSWDEVQVITFKTDVDMPDASILIGFQDVPVEGNQNTKGFQIKQIKLERGSKNTPWSPASPDEVNHVRLWAGTNFLNRKRAPFRVYQNGDVYANNGTFGGTIVGNINSGTVHIHDNEIVINSDQSFLDDTTGEMKFLRTRDWQPNPHLRLGQGESFIDTNFTLGSPNNRKLFFYKDSGDTGVFNITGKSRFNMVGGTGLSEFRFVCDRTGEESGLNISATNYGGHHVIRHSSAEENKGTLVFDSRGSVPGNRGDFAFTRDNFLEDVKVNIEGEVAVRTSVTTETNKIEIRMQSDGWGWYAN